MSDSDLQKWREVQSRRWQEIQALEAQLHTLEPGIHEITVAEVLFVTTFEIEGNDQDVYIRDTHGRVLMLSEGEGIVSRWDVGPGDTFKLTVEKVKPIPKRETKIVSAQRL